MNAAEKAAAEAAKAKGIESKEEGAKAARKFNVTAPNADYSGISHGVTFVAGKGTTADAWRAGMLKENGFDVTEEG